MYGNWSRCNDSIKNMSKSEKLSHLYCKAYIFYKCYKTGGACRFFNSFWGICLSSGMKWHFFSDTEIRILGL